MGIDPGLQRDNQRTPHLSIEDYDTVVIGGGPAGMLFLLTALGRNPFKNINEPDPLPWLPEGKICSLPGLPSRAFGKGPPDYDHYLTESGTDDCPRSAFTQKLENEFSAAHAIHPDALVRHAGAIATQIARENGKFKVTFSEGEKETVCTAKRLVIATGHSAKRDEATHGKAHLKGSEELCQKLHKHLEAVRRTQAPSLDPPDTLTVQAAAFRNFINDLPTDSAGRRVIGLVGDGPTMDEVIKILSKEREIALGHSPTDDDKDLLSADRFGIVVFSARCRSDIKKDRAKDWIRNLEAYKAGGEELSPVEQLANDAWRRVNGGFMPPPPTDPSSPEHYYSGTYVLARRLLALEREGILTVCGRLDWVEVKETSRNTVIHPKTVPPSSSLDAAEGVERTEKLSPHTETDQLELSLLIDCAPMPEGTHDNRNGRFELRSEHHKILNDLLREGIVEFDSYSERSKVGVLQSKDPNVLLIGAGFRRGGLSLHIWSTQSQAGVEEFRKLSDREKSDPFDTMSFSHDRKDGTTPQANA